MLPTGTLPRRVRSPALLVVLFLVLGGILSAGIGGAALPQTPDLAQAVLAAPAPARPVDPAAKPGAPLLTRPAPSLPPGARSRRPAAPATVLYDSLGTPGRGSTSSQNFEPRFDAYDDQVADDFVVPAGQNWTVDLIEVAGTYSGGGIANSANIFFYNTSGSMPDTPVLTRTNILYSPGLNPGDFTIALNPPVLLPAGTYWLSVQANQPFDPAGQWFWLTSASVRGLNGMYRNPGGGFGTACPDWGYCGYSFYEHDHMFRLSGLTQIPATVTGTPPTTTATPTPRTPTPTTTGTQTLPGPVLTQPAPFYSATPTPTATPIPPCGLAWRLVTSPNVGSRDNRLHAVAALAANDVWAVGYQADSTTSQTLIEHWNGTTWSIVSSPNAGPSNSQLESITAVSPNDIWAVGFYTDPNYNGQTLVLHWDGQVWSLVPSPNLSGGNYLHSVSASAANDVWAVGGTATQTLTLHWDGQSWSIVPSPNSGASGSYLRGVSARAANDVWAVGNAYTPYPFFHTLTMHWDGQAWTIIPSPNLGSYDNSLQAVTALAANNVWAVGNYDASPTVQTLILHWDGTSWTVVSSPNVPFASNLLDDVAAIGPNDIWAVGGGIDTLTLHWDGQGWSIVDSLSQSLSYELLTGVAAVNSRDVWTVGYYHDDNAGHELTQIEHYSDPCVTPTPSGTPTQTATGTPPTATRTPTLPPTVTGTPTPSRTPTRTGTPSPSTTPTPTRTPSPPVTPSATPSPPPSPTHTSVAPSPTRTATATLPATTTPARTPTATPCALQFTDVPSTNTFYTYIRCLACRGIVGGYPCGGPGEPCPGPYFRPNNNVTRGQVSKIVSESAGFTDPVPSTQQTFEDVAPGSTFALWIERLSTRGIIGGYPCGGPFEPCISPTNRPYFRPNNNVTRGQLSKIVSGAAGWTETPTAQTFEDVPPGSTFYLYIARMASRGIISGYPCGGPFEPCGAPLARPYFRPNNNATRGQMSKIAAAAFFPNCATPARR